VSNLRPRSLCSRGDTLAELFSDGLGVNRTFLRYKLAADKIFFKNDIQQS